jgi:hypothetical protein
VLDLRLGAHGGAVRRGVRSSWGRRRRPSAAATEEAVTSPVHVTLSSSGEDGGFLLEEEDESDEFGVEKRARRDSARGQASMGKAEVEGPAFLAAPSA